MSPQARACIFKLITPLLALTAISILAAWVLSRRHDLLITDARIVQGETLREGTFCVGVRSGRISHIGTNRVWAARVISGAGLVLTPGFIDVNSCGWLGESAAALKLMDGVTTFLNAHGDSFRADARRIGASEKLNYATSVGLIPAFSQKMDCAGMIAAIEDSLRFGAYTVSLSPEYVSATTPEIVGMLARHFANRSVLLTFHLRYSSPGEELDGVREAIDCAAQGNPVHLLHISSTGATFHPEEARRMIDKAVQEKGLRISYDFYPYTAWASSIHRARFEGDWRERYQVDFSKVSILGEANLTAERFAALQQDRADRLVIVDSIPPATVDYFATNTTCPIGTDSEASHTSTHPRGAGSFTKFINDYVDTGKLDFGRTIHRFSWLAARQFAPFIPGLEKRGRIEVGYVADLVLWDRDRIKSNATFANPRKPSSGVVAVLVNGVSVVMEGSVVADAAPGKHLKGNHAAQWYNEAIRQTLGGGCGPGKVSGIPPLEGEI